MLIFYDNFLSHILFLQYINIKVFSDFPTVRWRDDSYWTMQFWSSNRLILVAQRYILKSSQELNVYL